MKTTTRLLRFGDPPRHPLVVEHVGVATASIVINREGVPAEDDNQARILFQLADRLGIGTSSSVLGESELGSALECIELARKVLRPQGWLDASLV